MNPNSPISASNTEEDPWVARNRTLQKTFLFVKGKAYTYIVARPELVDPLGFRIFRIHVVVVRRSTMDMTAFLPPHILLKALDSKTERPKHNKHHCLLLLVCCCCRGQRTKPPEISSRCRWLFGSSPPLHQTLSSLSPPLFFLIKVCFQENGFSLFLPSKAFSSAIGSSSTTTTTTSILWNILNIAFLTATSPPNISPPYKTLTWYCCFPARAIFCY